MKRALSSGTMSRGSECSFEGSREGIRQLPAVRRDRCVALACVTKIFDKSEYLTEIPLTKRKVAWYSRKVPGTPKAGNPKNEDAPVAQSSPFHGAEIPDLTAAA